MPNYLRYHLPNHLVFITLVTADRKPFLLNYLSQFRTSIEQVKNKHPFNITAMVVLPDHCHFIMKMPENDCDFSNRINQIKGKFSRLILDQTILSQSRINRQERGVWQRRFWDHVIRDQDDFKRHMDYIHYNPVKHRYVNACKDWPYSSFHRLVKEGLYDENWATNEPPKNIDHIEIGE